MLYNVNGLGICPDEISANVKDFGATGDGVTDDTTAIQSALDSCKSTGGTVFFPEGVYIVTAYLTFYSHQALIFKPGAILKQGAAITALLLPECASTVTEYNGTHDCLIYGATFDGGDYTTNNTLSGAVHARNIVFENCTFKNAYGAWHDLEFCGCYNCKIINCDFEGSRKTDANGCLVQIDPIGSNGTWPWDDRGVVDGTVCKYIEVSGCIFHACTIAPGIGNHSGSDSLPDELIRVHDCIFDGLTTNRAAIQLNKGTAVDVYNNTFNGCKYGVGYADATYCIHDNRFIGVTTAFGSNANGYNNMINGTFTV